MLSKCSMNCFLGQADLGDEMAEDSVSVMNGALELSSSADSLSPDDLTRVDSCLVNDADLLNTDWSAVNDALVEILVSQPELQESPASTADDGSVDIYLQAPSKQAGNMLVVGGSECVDELLENKGMEIDYERLPDLEETAMTSLQPSGEEASEATVIDVFLPHYREDKKKVIEPVDAGLDETKPSSVEDIFRIWDLGIPAEVNEISEQLKNALSGSSSVRTEPLRYGNPKELIDSEEESLDDLIAGIKVLNLD